MLTTIAVETMPQPVMFYIHEIICLVEERLRTEVPRTPSSAQLGLELMTSRS